MLPNVQGRHSNLPSATPSRTLSGRPPLTTSGCTFLAELLSPVLAIPPIVYGLSSRRMPAPKDRGLNTSRVWNSLAQQCPCPRSLHVLPILTCCLPSSLSQVFVPRASPQYTHSWVLPHELAGNPLTDTVQCPNFSAVSTTHPISRLSPRVLGPSLHHRSRGLLCTDPS